MIIIINFIIKTIYFHLLLDINIFVLVIISKISLSILSSTKLKEGTL